MVRVADLEASLDFYCGKLGLREVSRIENDRGRFTLVFLCAPGDELACIYGWGFAARTRRASAQVVLGAMAIRDAFPDIPVFTRAATPAGERIICGKMEYRPYPGAPDDLLWNPVRASQERAA